MVDDAFTFHNVSINTASGSGQAAGTSDFTFHNVSINTDIDWGNKEVIIYFTFHNVSINTLSRANRFREKNGPLHSTMFLLIRNRGSYPGRKLQHFTFHNVSINTCLVNILRLL